MKNNFLKLLLLSIACMIALMLGACSAGSQITNGGASTQQSGGNPPNDGESIDPQELRGRVKSISGDILELEILATPPVPYIDDNGEIPLANEDYEAFKKQVVEDGGEIIADDGNIMMIVLYLEGNKDSPPEAKAVRNAYTDDGKQIGIVICGAEEDVYKYTGESRQIMLEPDTVFLKRNERGYLEETDDSNFLKAGVFVGINYQDSGAMCISEEPAREG